jgi:hypothetical protein
LRICDGTDNSAEDPSQESEIRQINPLSPDSPAMVDQWRADCSDPAPEYEIGVKEGDHPQKEEGGEAVLPVKINEYVLPDETGERVFPEEVKQKESDRQQEAPAYGSNLKKNLPAIISLVNPSLLNPESGQVNGYPQNGEYYLLGT